AVYDRSGVVSAPAQGAEAAEAGELANAAAAKSAQGSEKKAQVQEAVARLNDYVQSVQRDLQFELDEGSGRSVIQVVDRKTQEVVRQIPDELALKMARSLQQDEPLTLLNAKV
ncbi:MAG: flagellar protein FlaG, partial [Gammaproteobacteria bacterium]|nr:flagellar protein FlaG [Gammaproteobacteria bacterium]